MIKKAEDASNLLAKHVAGMTLKKNVIYLSNDKLVMSFDVLNDLLKEQQKQ